MIIINLDSCTLMADADRGKSRGRNHVPQNDALKAKRFGGERETESKSEKSKQNASKRAVSEGRRERKRERDQHGACRRESHRAGSAHPQRKMSAEHLQLCSLP